MNWKQSMARILAVCFIVVHVIAVYKVQGVVIRGYQMYRDAVAQESISDKLEEIQSNESYVSLDEISPEYIQTLVSVEDKRFYQHCGFDLLATTRAMATNLLNGRIVAGGSGITQQLSKNMYFSFEKRYERKVAELFMSFQLEQKLSKDEIIELYCNVVYFGEGCTGIKEAANHYYHVEPDKIHGEQVDVLVDTLKCPNRNNPNARISWQTAEVFDLLAA